MVPNSNLLHCSRGNLYKNVSRAYNLPQFRTSDLRYTSRKCYHCSNPLKKRGQCLHVLAVSMPMSLKLFARFVTALRNAAKETHRCIGTAVHR
jgi:hypothetical protein